MALPQFRYIWARLSPLAHPAVLTTGLFALLAGAFALEFARNPNWYQAYDPDEEDANGDLVSSELTPEEQAQWADIDNLSFLTNSIGDESAGSEASASQSEPTTLLQQLLGSTTIDSDATASEESTLNRYLDRFAALELNSIDPSTNIYRSIFESAGGADSNPSASWLNLYGQARAGASGGSPLINSNPLSHALQTLISGSSGTTTATNTTATAGTGETGAIVDEPTVDGVTITDPFGLNGVFRPVTLPTIPGTFSPTTPAMSPPLGTTGYTPPASLPLIPPLNTNLGNAYTNLGVPNNPIGAGTNRNLNLTVPGVNNRGGVPLPNTTVSPSINVPTPSPFAVQGIPGSYTGGGYINTFSNPGQVPGQ